jgi:hypothetical protein
VQYRCHVPRDRWGGGREKGRESRTFERLGAGESSVGHARVRLSPFLKQKSQKRRIAKQKTSGFAVVAVMTMFFLCSLRSVRLFSSVFSRFCDPRSQNLKNSDSAITAPISVVACFSRLRVDAYFSRFASLLRCCLLLRFSVCVCVKIQHATEPGRVLQRARRNLANYLCW